MHAHKASAKAMASAKLSRMTGHGDGTSSAGDGVNEHYGTKAAGPSDSAEYKHGGAISGGKAKPRFDKAPREAFKRGGAVKAKGKGTTVNIIVGRDAHQPVPMPVPVGGPPPGGLPPAMTPPQRPPMPMPMPGPGMAPPGAPPGGMPMRKAGGRVMIKGGAGSGEGRLEKAASAKRAK